MAELTEVKPKQLSETEQRKLYAQQLALKYQNKKAANAVKKLNGGSKSKPPPVPPVPVATKDNTASTVESSTTSQSLMQTLGLKQPQAQPTTTAPVHVPKPRSFYDSSEGIQMESVDESSNENKLQSDDSDEEGREPANGGNTTNSLESVAMREGETKREKEGEEEKESTKMLAFDPESVTDEQFLYAVKRRLLEAQKMEQELAEVKKRLLEAEVTSEQLVIKLGKEKELVEQLKDEIKQLTKHNTRLVEILGDVSQTKQSRNATPPSKQKPHRPPGGRGRGAKNPDHKLW